MAEHRIRGIWHWRYGSMLDMRGNLESGALFSSDGVYRYAVWRTWGGSTTLRLGGVLIYVGLNPSKANHIRGDATFDRGCTFARWLGHAGVVFINLAAFVSSKPSLMLKAADPFGRHNAIVQGAALRLNGMVLAGWGHLPGGDRLRRASFAFEDLARGRGITLHCFGRNADGSPKHLLARGKHRIPDRTMPEVYRDA